MASQSPRLSARAVAAAAAAAACGCLSPAVAADPPAYHNPLDLLDGGAPSRVDGGPPSAVDDGGALGPIDGRTFSLTSAVYRVQPGDAGAAATFLWLSDLADLCSALGADGGLGPDWNAVRIELNGGAPGDYPVAAVLAPAGAIARFFFHSAAGSFGSAAAASGDLTLAALDAANQQPASGSYALSFGADAGAAIAGTFAASPCPSASASGD